MNIHFKITDKLLADIKSDLARKHPFADERYAFVACKRSSDRGGLLLLAQTFLSMPDEWYVDDPRYGCVFSSEAILQAMQFSLSNDACMFHVHRHDHYGVPWFSRTDLRESAKYVPDFWDVSPKLPHGTLVLSLDRAAGLCWYPGGGKPFKINKLTNVGIPVKDLGK